MQILICDGSDRGGGPKGIDHAEAKGNLGADRLFQALPDRLAVRASAGSGGEGPRDPAQRR